MILRRAWVNQLIGDVGRWWLWETEMFLSDEQTQRWIRIEVPSLSRSRRYESYIWQDWGNSRHNPSTEYPYPPFSWLWTRLRVTGRREGRCCWRGTGRLLWMESQYLIYTWGVRRIKMGISEQGFGGQSTLSNWPTHLGKFDTDLTTHKAVLAKTRASASMCTAYPFFSSLVVSLYWLWSLLLAHEIGWWGWQLRAKPFVSLSSLLLPQQLSPHRKNFKSRSHTSHQTIYHSLLVFLLILNLFLAFY